MSLQEAVLAMLAMVIVLCFVLFYYCILPCYNNYKKHSWTREPDNGEDWECDPRWNNQKFQFVPRKPSDYLTDKKYSRLAACSRTSSMRSNLEESPNLDVEASQPMTVPLTGKPKLTKKPPKYSELYKTSEKTGSVGSVSSTNTGSLSNPPEYTSKTPSIEKNLNQEQALKEQSNNVAVAPKSAPQKVKIMKPPKKNRKPVVAQGSSDVTNTTTECSKETQKETT